MGFPSQDVVDRPGSRALWCAGLGLGAAGGEGGQVPQGGRSTAGLWQRQAVHNARQALQTGGTPGFVIQTV